MEIKIDKTRKDAEWMKGMVTVRQGIDLETLKWGRSEVHWKAIAPTDILTAREFARCINEACNLAIEWDRDYGKDMERSSGESQKEKE